MKPYITSLKGVFISIGVKKRFESLFYLALAFFAKSPCCDVGMILLT